MQSHLSYSHKKPSEFASNMTTDSARLRLFGNISKSKNGKRVEEEQLNAPQILREIIAKLQEKLETPLHREELLILVNGVEVNSLDDLDTQIRIGDVIEILPIYHGGS